MFVSTKFNNIYIYIYIFVSKRQLWYYTFQSKKIFIDITLLKIFKIHQNWFLYCILNCQDCCIVPYQRYNNDGNNLYKFPNLYISKYFFEICWINSFKKLKKLHISSLQGCNVDAMKIIVNIALPRPPSTLLVPKASLAMLGML